MIGDAARAYFSTFGYLAINRFDIRLPDLLFDIRERERFATSRTASARLAFAALEPSEFVNLGGYAPSVGFFVNLLIGEDIHSVALG